MNVDVARARDAVSSTLQAALAASREHSAGLAAIAVGEGAAWEAVAEALVPRLEGDVLRVAGGLVGEPRLEQIQRAHDDAVAAATARRDALADEILEPVEFEAVSARRKAVDARLLDARSRVKELRARPGMLLVLEAAQKGARLKEDQARAVHVYDEVHGATLALEAESSRLGAIVARHHRAHRELTNADDDVRALGDRFLHDARGVVVARLTHPDGPRPARPDVAHAAQVAAAAAARRAVLTVLYESWVRPHGVVLMGLEAEAVAGISGFETVSWPARAELACREATVAVEAYRQRAAQVVAFVPPPTPVPDWWRALVPDVPRPDDAVFASLGVPAPLRDATPIAGPTALQVADAVGDRLAAAWASVRDGDLTQGLDDDDALPVVGQPVPDPLSPGETEVMVAVPRAPAIARHTNATVAISSAEYQEIIDDPPGDDRDVFGMATSSPSLGDRFQRPTVSPSSPAPVTYELPRPTFAPGSTVGRCVVQGLVGKGGMGEVYRARLEGELGFSRQVVLKRLALDYDEDDTLLASFAREAEVAARIAHPNVVQIFDLQRHGGEPVMVMEYLEGLSLQKLAVRAWKAGIVLDAAVLGRCALDAARGLHAAHTMRGDDGALVGLIHRDVSPDNLFLCATGFTKLLDFGVARRGDLKTMTGKAELKGKIPYMSPEQILGDELDARSDLFSLGSTLYYLLTGRRPFTGDNDVTTLFAVVNKAHRPLREARPDAPELVDVVEQLLQKAPDDRPRSALEVVQRLQSSKRVAEVEETAAFLRRIEEL